MNLKILKEKKSTYQDETPKEQNKMLGESFLISILFYIFTTYSQLRCYTCGLQSTKWHRSAHNFCKLSFIMYVTNRPAPGACTAHSRSISSSLCDTHFFTKIEFKLLVPSLSNCLSFLAFRQPRVIIDKPVKISETRISFGHVTVWVKEGVYL